MNQRRRAGLSIAATRGAVEQVTRDQWRVTSQSTDGTSYLVTRHTNLDGEHAFECECPDHAHRASTCKHIHAVMDRQAAEEYVIGLFLAGTADGARAKLQQRLLGWLSDEQRDKCSVVWLAHLDVAARAGTLAA